MVISLAFCWLPNGCFTFSPPVELHIPSVFTRCNEEVEGVPSKTQNQMSFLLTNHPFRFVE